MIYQKLISILFVFYLLPFYSFSQNPYKDPSTVYGIEQIKNVNKNRADSLYYYYNSKKLSEPDKLNHLIRLIRSFIYKPEYVDSVDKYSRIILKTSPSFICQSDSLNVYFILFNSFKNSGEFTKALFAINKANKLNISDSLLLIDIYSKRAHIFSKLNMTNDAAEDYLRLKSYSHLMSEDEQCGLNHSLANQLFDKEAQLELRLKVYNQRKRFYKLNTKKDFKIRMNLAAASINLCRTYIQIDKLDSAEYYGLEALKYRKGDIKSIYEPYLGLGYIYLKKKDYKKAVEYLNSAYDILKKHPDQKPNFFIAISYLIKTHFHQKEYSSVIVHASNLMSNIKDVKFLDESVMSAIKLAAIANHELGNTNKSNEYLKFYKNKLNENSNLNRVKDAKTQANLKLVLINEKKIIAEEKLQIETQKERNRLASNNLLRNSIYVTLGIIGLIIIVFVYTAYINNLRGKLNLLLNERNNLIASQRESLVESIEYANKIQTVLFDSFFEINKTFNEHFVFYQAKETVGGDYYGYYNLNGKHLIFCVDCSGSGVFGAFLSLICNAVIEKAIKRHNSNSPEEILSNVQDQLKEMLMSDEQGQLRKEHINMSFYMIDKEKKEISYSNTQSHGILSNGSSVIPLVSQNHSIEMTEKGFNTDFVEEKINYQDGDMLYMLTNGYIDQYGGGSNRKFSLDNLIELIRQTNSFEVQNQADLFEYNFNKWKGSEPQTDDILLIGIRLC